MFPPLLLAGYGRRNAPTASGSSDRTSRSGAIRSFRRLISAGGGSPPRMGKAAARRGRYAAPRSSVPPGRRNSPRCSRRARSMSRSSEEESLSSRPSRPQAFLSPRRRSGRKVRPGASRSAPSVPADRRPPSGRLRRASSCRRFNAAFPLHPAAPQRRVLFLRQGDGTDRVPPGAMRENSSVESVRLQNIFRRVRGGTGGRSRYRRSDGKIALPCLRRSRSRAGRRRTGRRRF